MAEVKRKNLTGNLSTTRTRKKVKDTTPVNLDSVNPDKKTFSLKDSNEVIQRTNMELPQSEYFELKSYCMRSKKDLKDYVYNAIKKQMLSDKII